MVARLYKTLIFPEQAAAATPPSGTVAFYAKSDGRFYGKDDAGVEFTAGMPAQIAGSVDVLAGLVTQGLRAASANPPLNLGSGAITAGGSTFSGTTTATQLNSGTDGVGSVGLFRSATGSGSGAGDRFEMTVPGAYSWVFKTGTTLSNGDTFQIYGGNARRFELQSDGKTGFFGAAGVAQPAGNTDILASLVTLNLRAASSNPPLNLGSGTLTAGAATFSGDVGLTRTGASDPIFSISGDAGRLRQISFQSAGSHRWILRANSAAESGSDVGSDLELISRTDAGALKTTVLLFTRSTGAVTFGGLVVTPASASGSAGLNVPHGTAPSAPTNGDVWTTTAGLFARINGATVGPYAGAGGFASLTADNTWSDGVDFILGSTNGTMWGTATTQKQAWWGATPVAQISGSTDVLAGLVTVGLRAASSNPPLNLGSGTLTAGIATIATSATVAGSAVATAATAAMLASSNTFSAPHQTINGSPTPTSQYHLGLGRVTAVSGTESARLTFLGNTIDHGGIYWVPNSTVANSALILSRGGNVDPSSNTTMATFYGDGRLTIAGGFTSTAANLGTGMLTAGSWTTTNSLISAAAGLLGASGYMQYRSLASGSTGIVITPNTGGASELALYSTDFQASQVNTEFLDIAALAGAEYVFSTGATGTGTRRGLKFDTLRLGFFNTAPAAQIAGSTDLLAGLVTLGLRAASANPPLNLGTGAITSGAITASGQLIVSGGTFRVDAQGRVAIGNTAINADVMMVMQATHPSSTNYLYGFAANPTSPLTNTDTMNAIYGSVTTAAASFTLTRGVAIRAGAPTRGAGSTIAEAVGLYVDNQGATGVTNAYGIHVIAQSSAATANYAVQLDGGTTANLWLKSNTATEAGGIGFGATLDTSLSRNAAGLLQIGDAAGANSAIIVTDKAITDGQVAVHRTGAPGNIEWADPVHSNTHIEIIKNPGAATVTAVGTAAPTLTATPSSTDGTDGAWLTSSTTATSGNPSGIISAFTVVQTSWLPELTFRIKTGASITALRLWIGLFSASPDASATPAIHLAAFRYAPAVDGTAFWRCCTDNGSGTPTVTTTTQSIVLSTVYVMRLAFRQSDGACLFYINGALVATHTATLPTTTTLLGYGVRVTTVTNGIKTILTGRIGMSYV